MSADGDSLDPDNPPPAGRAALSLGTAHWTGLDTSAHSWQLQLFVERHIGFQPDSGQWVDLAPDADGGIRIRSNPVLLTVTREVP